MTEKLLPCPFCGGKADYCETNAWWVRCNECNAETEADMSPEAAAEIWNRRTPPPSSQLDGPADPDADDTISILKNDLEAVVHRHLTAALEASR